MKGLPEWNRRTGVLLFLVVAALFLVANRGAFKGYFQDDELDNLSWTSRVPLSVYAESLVTPRFNSDNFRPLGHYYFAFMGPRFGLDFPKYIWPIQALHLLNVWLVWLLARRLGAGPFAAGAAALLFSFHMAVFDVFWKPMYVFDLLCATFCLASLLCWMRGRWVLSFVAFFLAYKSKELAVMLPAVLACYEFWLGKRRWKPLIPFFLVSASFGLQAVFQNAHHDDDYTFRFHLRALRTTVEFYASRLALLPYGGLLLLPLPLLVRDRRVWFGMAVLLLFFVPLAFLPGRMFAAYCYVPLIGLAIMTAGIAERGHRIAIALFFLAWIPFNFMQLRINRRQALAIADENRAYVTALASYVRSAPDTRQFICDGRPFNFHPWGVQGALNFVRGNNDARVSGTDGKAAVEALRGGAPVAILSWDPRGKLFITAHSAGAPDAPFIRMDRDTPIWQLDDGWFPLESGFRWTRDRATAHLRRPEGAHCFELTVNIGPDLIRVMKRTDVRVFLDGQLLGRRTFTASGWQTVRWDIPPAPAGRVSLELRSDPFRAPPDPRTLGVAVVSFGFIP